MRILFKCFCLSTSFHFDRIFYAVAFVHKACLIIMDLNFQSMSDSDPNKLMDKVSKISVVCIGIGLVMGTSNLIEVRKCLGSSDQFV